MGTFLLILTTHILPSPPLHAHLCRGFKCIHTKQPNSCGYNLPNRFSKPPSKSETKTSFAPLSQAESCWCRCLMPPRCCRLSGLHTRSEISCLGPWAPPPPPVWAYQSADAGDRLRPCSGRKRSSLDQRNRILENDESTTSPWIALEPSTEENNNNNGEVDLCFIM